MVWLNKFYLVQVFDEDCGLIRLSINRTEMQAGGEWKDGISWDALQQIKDELGYADRDAVEIFPARQDVVNVVNMRHLWVLPEKIPFAWREKEEGHES